MALPSSGRGGPRRVAASFAVLFLAAAFPAEPRAPATPAAATPEAALASALLGASTADEREALLARGGFDVPALVKALDERFTGFNRAGDPDGADSAARLMAHVADRYGDAAARRRAHGALGVHLFNTGEYEESMAEHQRALALAEGAGNRLDTARARLNIGLALAELGFYERAEHEYQQAFALAEAEGSRVGMAIVTGNLGMVHQYRGDDLFALQAYQRALAIVQPGDKGVEPSVFLANIGQMLDRLGHPDLAIPYFQRALAAAEASGYLREVPSAYLHLAGAERDLGRETQARVWAGKALALAESQGNKRIEMLALRSLGNMDAAAGQRAKARARFEAGLEIARAGGLRRQEASLKASLARLHRDDGRLAEARRMVEESLALARAVGSPDLLSGGLSLLADLLAAQGRRPEAFAALAEAIAHVEGWRWRVGGGETASRFFEDKLTPYHAMVRLLVEDGRLAEALSYAERARARALVDALHQAGDGVTAAMDEEERREERRLEERMAALNRQLGREHQSARPRARRLADLAARLDGARSEYDTFRARLYASHPELQAQRGETPPLSLDEAGALLPGPQAAILEYVAGADGLHVFVLTREAGRAPALAVFQVAATRDEIERRVRRFREAVARRDLDFQDEARALHRLLLGPARALLEGRRDVVIVPDGALWELPFQALRTPQGRFVVQDHAVSYAPSLTALRSMQQRTSVRPAASILVVANPKLAGPRPSTGAAAIGGEGLVPLPETERQAAALRRLYGPTRTRVLLSTEAREETIKTAMAGPHVLHFATHGLLNGTRPLYSHLVLAAPRDSASEDGILEAREVLRMRLPASLAVLSACETGRGRVAQGEGVIGLTWAFFVAGVPTTVVSQWKVESASTTELMVGFHRELRRGATRAEALRRASAAVLGRPEYRHPFYWAGFIVVGDPRR